jgi:AbrB family looped-hinge helix DNA binding protein
MLSPKRQITIPKELCDRLNVKPGDEVDIYEHDDKITLIKKRKGSSGGALKHLKADDRVSDEESLLDSVGMRRSRRGAGKGRAA